MLAEAWRKVCQIQHCNLYNSSIEHLMAAVVVNVLILIKVLSCLGYELFFIIEPVLVSVLPIILCYIRNIFIWLVYLHLCVVIYRLSLWLTRWGASPMRPASHLNLSSVSSPVSPRVTSHNSSATSSSPSHPNRSALIYISLRVHSIFSTAWENLRRWTWWK